MKIKIIFLILVLLISTVSAAEFIGSFTIKETEGESNFFGNLKEFIGEIPIIGNFVVQAQFGINAGPICFQNIPDQEWFKNTDHTLDLEPYFEDPNAGEILDFELNDSYEHIFVVFDNFEETATFTPEFNFVGVIPDVVIRATDPFGLFCDSNPFDLIIKDVDPPKPPPPPGGSSSGGGGSSKEERFPNFILDKNVLKVEMYPLDTIEENVTVTNIGDFSLDIKVSNEMPNFVKLLEDTFFLKKKESKVVDIIVSAPEFEPDVYLGKIKFISEGITRTLLVVVTLLERDAEILVDVAVPDEYKRVVPGGDVKAKVTINTENIPKDVEITYQIRDVEDNVFVSESESVNLNEFRTQLEKTLRTEKSFDLGFYQFFVNIAYGGEEYVATDIFEISLEPREERPALVTIRQIIIGISIVALLVLIVGLYLFTRSKLFKIIVDRIKEARKPKSVVLTREQIRLLTVRKLRILLNNLDKGEYVKRYMLILKRFVASHYSIRYSFTVREAVREIREKEHNKYMIKLLDEIGTLFYIKHEPSKKKMREIILKTIKILIDYGKSSKTKDYSSLPSLKR